MSNLYKAKVNQNKGDFYTRVIDYNELLEQKLSAFSFEQEKKLRMQQAQAAGGGEDSDAQFSEGLFAQQLEVPPELEIDYVEHAKEEADQIVREATAQAEEILKKAVQEAENLKDAARQEAERLGYAEGMERVNAEAEQIHQELDAQRRQQEQEYADRLTRMEPELMEVVIQVFDKVLHTDLAGRKQILLHLIQSTVQNIKNSREFRIRVSAEDYANVSAHREEILQKIGGEIILDVVMDESLQQGQCTIDTDEGLFDCGLDVQFENLTKDLKALSCMDEE